MGAADNLEALLARGQDGAVLRYGLASAYYGEAELEKTIEHASVAVRLDADYSAAWRLLGKAQADAGLPEQAAESFRRGIAAAGRRGDKQAEKEMGVFLRRLERRG